MAQSLLEFAACRCVNEETLGGERSLFDGQPFCVLRVVWEDKVGDEGLVEVGRGVSVSTGRLLAIIEEKSLTTPTVMIPSRTNSHLQAKISSAT